jgi:hypothetical protein
MTYVGSNCVTPSKPFLTNIARTRRVDSSSTAPPYLLVPIQQNVRYERDGTGQEYRATLAGFTIHRTLPRSAFW